MNRDAQIVEQRLGVVYELCDSFASVVVVSNDEDAWNHWVHTIDNTLLGCDIDWAGPPASLAQLLGL